MAIDRDNNPVVSKTLLNRIVQSFSGEPQSKDELLEVLSEARSRGVVDADALAMILGVFEVAEMQVRDIMIPRSQMVVIEREAGLEEMLPVILDSGHSRYPVIGDSRDEIVGVLLAKDLLRHYREQPSSHFEINDVLRQAVFVPESKRLNTLLKEFRASRNHMAIVVDEYGGVAGLVTIEDVLEQIVGDIDDEHDAEEDLFIKPQGHGRFSVKALTPIDEFNEFFDASFDDEEFDTIGGLVTNHLGHMPKRGENATLQGFKFNVIAADSRRLHLLRVIPRDKNAPAADVD